MQEKYKNLISLMEYLEEFEAIKPDGNMQEFSFWLSNRLISPENNGKEINSVSQDIRIESFPKVEFATNLTTLYRFARHYIKKALERTSLNTVDEFGFLASLVENESISKSELINRHLIEISSGIEVLKRLLKNGLVSEKRDPNDGRSRLVSLTPKGRVEIFTAFAEMHKVAEIVSGNLSENEHSQALKLLNKLKYFHWNIHIHDKDSGLEELMEKYLRGRD